MIHAALSRPAELRARGSLLDVGLQARCVDARRRGSATGRWPPSITTRTPSAAAANAAANKVDVDVRCIEDVLRRPLRRARWARRHLRRADRGPAPPAGPASSRHVRVPEQDKLVYGSRRVSRRRQWLGVRSLRQRLSRAMATFWCASGSISSNDAQEIHPSSLFVDRHAERRGRRRHRRRGTACCVPPARPCGSHASAATALRAARTRLVDGAELLRGLRRPARRRRHGRAAEQGRAETESAARRRGPSAAFQAPTSWPTSARSSRSGQAAAPGLRLLRASAGPQQTRTRLRPPCSPRSRAAPRQGTARDSVWPRINLGWLPTTGADRLHTRAPHPRRAPSTRAGAPAACD